MENKIKYKPERCEHCGQTTTYLVPLDRGAAIIVKALAAAIRRKGINCVHPGKEMEVPRREWSYERAVTEGVLPSNFIDNFSRVRFHGLIARVKGEAGNWCLTSKGARFLRGEPVARYVIRSKATKHNLGYYEPETLTVTVHELRKADELWQGINFDIVEGRIVTEPVVAKKEEAAKLF